MTAVTLAGTAARSPESDERDAAASNTPAEDEADGTGAFSNVSDVGAVSPLEHATRAAVRTTATPAANVRVIGVSHDSNARRPGAMACCAWRRARSSK